MHALCNITVVHQHTDNFPRFKRLSTLLLNNNHVSRIGTDLATQLPNLTCVVLTNNKISVLSELDPLGGCTHLTMLSLLENPVARQQHYRLYVVHKIPR
jgi:U2 small nuclear ribonucleoprotein A'